MSGPTRLDDLPDDVGEVLHSFAVMARFRRAADSPQLAESAVRREMQAVRDLFDDVLVEPQEPDGRWAVDVRFVVSSVDGERAVNGVHATLREAGLQPDEAWVAERLP
ncbi:MAG TPA: hypothetical protein VNU26_03245 [Mycobacteriales bacterium]|nr:hypothetical protein [Mycobacteriales bacterium]